jgi:hypothetical protein
VGDIGYDTLLKWGIPGDDELADFMSTRWDDINMIKEANLDI